MSKIHQYDQELQANRSSHTNWSLHTYTPQSHENLLKTFSRMTLPRIDVTALERENHRLKKKLKEAGEEIKKRETTINMLETRVREMGMSSEYMRQERSDIRERSEYYIELCDDDFQSSHDLISDHFNEVIRRYHKELVEKNNQIKQLREALEKCRYRPQNPGQQVHVNTSIADERLRRTEAAVKVFNEDLEEVKNQLQQSPLGEERYTPTSTRDEAVIEVLQRRQHFGMIADIEKMGQDFMRKLEFEEKLDKLHWQIETKRYEALKERNGTESPPKCSYNKEFEMLEITRNNLLKALGDLRAETKEKNSVTKEIGQNVQFKDQISFSTIQTLYNPSQSFRTTSDTNRTKSNQEWPDK